VPICDRIVVADPSIAAARRTPAAYAQARLAGIQPSTVKRHLADLRPRSGLNTEQLIYAGRATRQLSVPTLEPADLGTRVARSAFSDAVLARAAATAPLRGLARLMHPPGSTR
jgi:hypothetical protein